MFKGWAKDFVKKYHYDNPLAAAKWLDENVDKKHHEALRPFIAKAFADLGYTFTNKEDE